MSTSRSSSRPSSSSCAAITRCLLLATLALASEGASSDRNALRGAKRKGDSSGSSVLERLLAFGGFRDDGAHRRQHFSDSGVAQTGGGSGSGVSGRVSGGVSDGVTDGVGDGVTGGVGGRKRALWSFPSGLENAAAHDAYSAMEISNPTSRSSSSTAGANTMLEDEHYVENGYGDDTPETAYDESSSSGGAGAVDGATLPPSPSSTASPFTVVTFAPAATTPAPAGGVFFSAAPTLTPDELATASPTPIPTTALATPAPVVVVVPTPAPFVVETPPVGDAVPVPTPSYPMKVSAETPVMTIPQACTLGLPVIRWSNTTNRLYMEGEGCATISDLYFLRVEKDGWTPKGPIYILDENDNIDYAPLAITGKWLVVSDLYVRTGAVFYCRGSEIGGDCDELRIQSTGPQDFHEVRGHGGSLYFSHTVVTSWDTPAKEPQEVYEGGRSFLNCVSEFESAVNCTGQPLNDFGECRMDIINSEMGYMGWMDSESYGLTWKVRGFCVDKSNPEIFDTTNVYGDIIGSDVHHMYYGMYSYGHQGGVWTDNKMHDNHQYGFDPHDDSDFLTIARNEVYNNVNHGIIASKRCNNVEIYDNEVYDGGAAGIFLHRSSDSAKVYGNYVHDMADAGLAILESFDAEIYDNEFSNVKYGIRISLGGGNNDVHDNLFNKCQHYGLYTYRGSDDPEQTRDGRSGENKFRNNKILNTGYGAKIKEADNTVITGNTFAGTNKVEFYSAAATTWAANDVPTTTCTKIVSGVDTGGGEIPASTFTDGTSGLPSTDDC